MFGHVMPLASVSCNANGIINGTTAFFSQDKQNEVQHNFLSYNMMSPGY